HWQGLGGFFDKHIVLGVLNECVEVVGRIVNLGAYCIGVIGFTGTDLLHCFTNSVGMVLVTFPIALTRVCQSVAATSGEPKNSSRSHGCQGEVTRNTHKEVPPKVGDEHVGQGKGPAPRYRYFMRNQNCLNTLSSG